jgi:hypothetical protein
MKKYSYIALFIYLMIGSSYSCIDNAKAEARTNPWDPRVVSEPVQNQSNNFRDNPWDPRMHKEGTVGMSPKTNPWDPRIKNVEHIEKGSFSPEKSSEKVG